MPLVDWQLLWGKAEGGASMPGKCGKRGMAVWDKAPVTECQSAFHHLPQAHTPHCVISPLFLRRDRFLNFEIPGDVLYLGGQGRASA